MDGIIGLVMFVTIVFLVCSLCGWCCQRKQKGVVFSRPGDNVTNQYDPNYGHTNPYPTQSIVAPAQHAPVLNHQPAAYPRQQYHPPVGFGMGPYQPTSYPVASYPSYIPPTNTAPYPLSGPAGAPPRIQQSENPPYPSVPSYSMPAPAGAPPRIQPSENPPYPSMPTYPSVPVGTAPKLPSYQEATGSDATTSVTNELYTKQAPYNPNFN